MGNIYEVKFTITEGVIMRVEAENDSEFWEKATAIMETHDFGDNVPEVEDCSVEYVYTHPSLRAE